MQQFDVVVIGAGILGLASAYQLLKEQPHLKLAVIEKESEPARHQTGRNSGVIHSGMQRSLLEAPPSAVPNATGQAISFPGAGKL